MKDNVSGYRVIATPKDVFLFITYLVFERGVNINPDDDLTDYVDTNGNPTFSDEEAECYQGMMDASFGVCECYDVDIYEICMRVLAAYHFCDGNDTMKQFFNA